MLAARPTHNDLRMNWRVAERLLSIAPTNILWLPSGSRCASVQTCCMTESLFTVIHIRCRLSGANHPDRVTDQVIVEHIWYECVTVCVSLPNQACWSPCTSIARPKSASFTAAPFILLANNRFSGWDTHMVKQNVGQRWRQWETACDRRSSIKLGFLRNIYISCIWHSSCGGVVKVWESDGEKRRWGRGWVVKNLHNTVYGHGFVAIETTRESFRQRCRLHAKWKVYLGERQRVW